MEHKEGQITYSAITISYELIRSDRKTYAISVEPGGIVKVRVPRKLNEKFLFRFLEEKEDWITKKYLQAKTIEKELPPTEAEKLLIKRYKNAAREYIPKRVEHYASLLGVSYSTITIRDQKTRWGSCSSRGTLSFNWKLILAPPRVLDYVVLHELCHRREMNHSERFWLLVESIMPEYRDYKKWLKDNGNSFYKQ